MKDTLNKTFNTLQTLTALAALVLFFCFSQFTVRLVIGALFASCVASLVKSRGVGVLLALAGLGCAGVAIYYLLIK